MEEYTNSSSPETDGSDMFVDAAPTSPDDANIDTEPSAEEPEAETTVEKPAKEAPSTLKIKYNGEEKELTYDEAVVLAQKGMNYDKAIERERAAVSKVTGVLEHYAQANNMTLDEYVQFLYQQRDSMVVQRELEQIKQQYPDMDDGAAKELASIRAEKSREKIEKASADKKKAEDEAALKPWRDFITRYPDMTDASKIPPQVLEKVNAGATPIEAMLEHEMDELKTKLEAAEKNTKNKQKAVGSITSTASDKETDAFLLGLNG